MDRTNTTNKTSTKLWGGRFSKDVDASVIGWTDATTIDSKMTQEDIWGSLAHVTMLAHQQIIPVQDACKILMHLNTMLDEWNAGKWKLSVAQEDVHMNVEARLIEGIGQDAGGRMHTCRSRNDQVVLDCKMRTRRGVLELRQCVVGAIEALLARASTPEYLTAVMPSYTHVQHAQPVSVAYWLSHYAAVLLRDLERLERAYNTTDQNPLGAGAIAGTSFPIDRQITTDLLGFQSIHEHCLDATSSRDFMLEVLSSVSILHTTFSRLAEEFILWSSFEFGTLTLDDAFAMGSSMMPQKKNPGCLELLRGRTGRLNGMLVAGFTMMKGLPSGYNRDFHEEKEILFEDLDLAIRAASVVGPLVQSTTINLERMSNLSGANFSTATELANFLVTKHSVPFRTAHHISGSLVGKLSRQGKCFDGNLEICQEHLKANGITTSDEELLKVLDTKSVMMSYNSLGGTGPKAVGEMLSKMHLQLEHLKSTITK